MRLDRRGRRIGRNAWREYVTDLWRCATEAWWRQMEEATSLYSTEVAEYRQHTPPPRFADFLTSQKGTFA